MPIRENPPNLLSILFTTLLVSILLIASLRLVCGQLYMVCLNSYGVSRISTIEYCEIEKRICRLLGDEGEVYSMICRRMHIEESGVSKPLV